MVYPTFIQVFYPYEQNHMSAINYKWNAVRGKDNRTAFFTIYYRNLRAACHRGQMD